MTSADNRPLRVFLCHSSNDKPAVRELYQKLRAEPWIQPWLDEEELYPGQDWNMEIEKAVEAADAIIVCLSKGSITKEGYVQRELRIVLDFADYKPEGTLYIIPVRLEECEPPRRLRTWQYEDYFSNKRERAFQRLLVSLKRRAESLGLIEDSLQSTVDELARKGADEKVRQEAEEKTAHEKREREIQRTIVREAKRKKQREFVSWILNLVSSNSRWLRISSVVLLVFIFGGFGLSYLINYPPPASTATVSPIHTAALKSPTFTSIPFSYTITSTKTSIPASTKTLTPMPNLAIGSTRISEKDGMTLLAVPAGEFIMGSNNGNDDEKPVHTVYLDAFWIDETEVTNAMYAKCVESGACDLPGDTARFSKSWAVNYPVVEIDWYQATAYCSWAGRRLPTEAEWEKAARGDDGRTYPWGEGIDCTRSNYYLNCVGDTSIVKTHQSGASLYGAQDMAGNVREWVNDWYDQTYYQISPFSNPQGPSTGTERVLRGGSWYFGGLGLDSDVRSSFRVGYNPGYPFGSWIGFRCAHSP